MRKSYIVWWVLSASCVFGCLRLIYQLLFMYGQTHADLPGLLAGALAAGVFFYVGFRRYVEYQEYQEDRKIRNDFYKTNTKDK